MTDELVTIGRIVKPHGIRGEVAVDVISDVPGRFDAGVEVLVGGRPRRIVASRPHQGRLLVRFDGVGDRTQAETLRAKAIEATPIDPDGSDAYFVHELIGLPVVDEQDRALGNVRALIDLPSAAEYDLLEVEREDGSRWLLPAVDEFVEVEELDDAGLRLRIVDPPLGLLDPDEVAVAQPEPLSDTPADTTSEAPTTSPSELTSEPPTGSPSEPPSESPAATPSEPPAGPPSVGSAAPSNDPDAPRGDGDASPGGRG